MFVPKPKNAFQSPGTHNFGFIVVTFSFRQRTANNFSELDTHPKMPP